MTEKFLACYSEVFNEDGTQKNCGRKKCIQLIRAAEKLYPEEKPGKFGQTTTGFMDIDELKKVKHNLEVLQER